MTSTPTSDATAPRPDRPTPAPTTPAATTPPPPSWEATRLPWTSLTLDDARRRLSGWHFAKECLTDGEREILYVAEGLLRLLDARDPKGYAR